MEAATDQVISATGMLAGLCYGVGILALLWVFRRSIFRQRRRKTERPKPDEQRRRSVRARAEIENIEGRYWLDRYNEAQKFKRHAAPSSTQQQFLATLSAAQHKRRWG